MYNLHVAEFTLDLHIWVSDAMARLVKRNSGIKTNNDDLSVMRDKALDLGYQWDITKYPTPAWAHVAYELHRTETPYTLFLHHISKHALNQMREDWNKACVQRALPLIRLFSEYAPLSSAMPEDYYVAQADEELDPTWLWLDYMQAAVDQDEVSMAKLPVPPFHDMSGFITRMLWILYQGDNRDVVAVSRNMRKRWEYDCYVDLAHRFDAIAPWRLP